MTTITYTGADLSGSSGEKGRVLTLNNTLLTVDDRFFITHSGSYLYIDIDYTIDHKTTETTITFLLNIFDDTPITVAYDTVTPSERSPIAGKFSKGFKRIVDIAGKPIRIRYYLQTIGSVWDDDSELTEIAGSEVWTSGIVMPLNTKYGSEDYNLVEQGKLSTHNQRLYVNGSLDFTGTGSIFKIKIGMNGSPTQINNYTLVPLGGIPTEISEIQLYKKVYIQKLTNGSLIGEQ